MPSALNALPTITGTALGASLFAGTPAGQFKAPTAVTGFMVPMDSVNFYIQSRDEANVVLAVSTATSTQQSAILTNTYHKGATFYLFVGSIGATCTIGVNLLYRDPASGQNAVAARVSMDSVTASLLQIAQIYPGNATSGGGSGFVPGGQINGVLPQTYILQASITATASGGGANVTLQISQSKIL